MPRNIQELRNLGPRCTEWLADIDCKKMPRHIKRSLEEEASLD